MEAEITYTISCVSDYKIKLIKITNNITDEKQKYNTIKSVTAVICLHLLEKETLEN